MDTGDLIDAVRERRVVELHYEGRGARIVHPHAVYRTASGALRLDGVQVSGASRSGALADDFNRSSERYGRGLLASV